MNKTTSARVTCVMRHRDPSASPLSVRLPVLIVLCLTSIEAAAALGLGAAVNPNPVRPGEMLHVEFTVTNSDLVDRTGVVLTTVYPTGLNSVLPSNFGATCPPTFCEPGETVTWNLGTIPAGRSKTVDLPAFVAAATAAGTVITFNAGVTDSTLQVANVTRSTTVGTGTLYDIALRDHADPVTPGGLLTYRVTFGYREEALALATNTLVFTLPAGTSFLNASDGGTFAAGTVQWNLGQMAPGEGGTRQVTLVVNVNEDTVLEASAQIFNAAVPANQATGTALTVVDVVWPLSVHVDAHPDPARPGELVNVQIVVTNHDAVTRNNLSLRVRYPDGASAIANGNVNGGACPPNFCEPGEQLVFAIASLGAGRSVTLEMPSAIAVATPDGTLINYYAMLSDAIGGNATAIDSVLVRTLPNYDLALRDSADPVVQLSTIAYKIAFGYRAEAPTPAATTLRFRLPDNVGFLSASQGGVFENNTVTWDVGTLDPGHVGSREVLLQASGADGTVLRATAQIFATADTIEQAGAEALTVVHSSIPISVDIDANADPARPGEQLNVQAVVTNRDLVARTMTLRIRYPDGASVVLNSNLVGGSCPPNACDPGEILTFAIGSVPAGRSVNLELPARVAAGAVNGQLVGFVGLLSDTAGGNASSSDFVGVRSTARFDLAVRESIDPARPGDRLAYKLAFGHREESPTNTTATLIAKLAPGTSFVSASGNGVASGDTVTWSLGTMAPGDGGFRELTVDVQATAPDTLPFAARIESATDAREAAWAEAVTTVDADPVLALQVDANADPARTEMLNVQFVVTNRDAVSHNVTLRARYPDDVFAISNGNIGWNPPGGCPPTFCEPGEMVVFSLGDLAAGHSATVEIMPSVATAAADGTLINFFAIATDSTGRVATGTDAVRVDTTSRYDLAIRDSVDAVMPGESLTYKLTYGYRSDAPVVADSRLRFRLPAGTSFVSATGGGQLTGNEVLFDVGPMNPGDGGVRTVTVDVDASDADVLQAQASIFDVARPFEQALAEALTVVDADPALSLAVNVSANPTQAQQQLLLEMVITNLTAVDRTVSLRLRYPDGLFSLNVAQTSPTGSCPPTFCDPTEMITWNLGILGAGQSRTVTVMPTVHNTVVNGQLINFFAIVTDTAGGIATGIDTARVGLCANNDSDCDGLADNADNCILEDNADQRDTDADGIGNACDADLNQSCLVNFADLAALKQRFLSSDPHADFDGNGIVTFGDLAIMKQQFLRPPGPSGVANLCSP